MPPAARITDMHVCPMVTPGTPPIPHVGGPIIKGQPTVLTLNMPQARITDQCVCVGPPDIIVKGSMTVLVGNLPAARMGDTTAHGGTITTGALTVLIGDGSNAGGGGAGASSAMPGNVPFSEPNLQMKTMIAAYKEAKPFCEVCESESDKAAKKKAAKKGGAVSSSSSSPAKAASQEATPKTNKEIRQWYNEEVSKIPDLNDEWVAQGLPAEERAKKAYDIRHNARLKARDMMQNDDEVEALQKRDLQKYGNKDGPTFDQLVEKEKAKGSSDEDAYTAIIGSSNRTDRLYNKKYGEGGD